MSEPIAAIRELLARIYSTVAYNQSAEAAKTREALLIAERLADLAEAATPEPVEDASYPSQFARSYARSSAATPSATPAAEGLDAAWKAAEAALPEGWIVAGVFPSGPNPLARVAWNAEAWGPWERRSRSCASIGDSGPTPAAALRALAARLAADTATEGES